MTEQLISSSALKGTFTSPLLYLSSAEAGWTGLEAQVFHQPEAGWKAPGAQTWQGQIELESSIIPAMSEIALVLFRGGDVRLELRHMNSPWQVLHIRQGNLLLRDGASAYYEARWKSYSSTPTQTLHLHLSKDLLVHVAEEVGGYDLSHLSLVEPSGFEDPLLTQIGFTLWRELEQHSPAGKLYAQTAARMLAVHLLRHYTSAGGAFKVPSPEQVQQPMKRVIDFVQAHLNQDLSIEILAHQVGFSPYHFARLFRQTMGESPHQFVLQQRIKRAQCLLKETDVPLAHVALESGFANQSYLTQVFKRHLGLTPRTYRQDRSI
jgi:AraC family transcriptional regulator